jgi:hypothetical protein
MSGTALWPWVVLLCLGALHGLTPGLGWLFAVALGLQERRRATVYRALGPITLGHALSITAVLVVVGGIQVVVSESIVHDVSAAVLGAFGLYRLIRSWHPHQTVPRHPFRQWILPPTLIGSRALAAYGDVDGLSAANNHPWSRKCTARRFRKSDTSSSAHGCAGTHSAQLGLNIAKLLCGASCEGFAVNAPFTAS